MARNDLKLVLNIIIYLIPCFPVLKMHKNAKSKCVTDRPTDQPTDRVTYRVACTRLKKTKKNNGIKRPKNKRKSPFIDSQVGFFVVFFVFAPG